MNYYKIFFQFSFAFQSKLLNSQSNLGQLRINCQIKLRKKVQNFKLTVIVPWTTPHRIMIAQMAERLTTNMEVLSSSPRSGSNEIIFSKLKSYKSCIDLGKIIKHFIHSFIQSIKNQLPDKTAEKVQNFMFEIDKYAWIWSH